jgi:hypothetical protein
VTAEKMTMTIFHDVFGSVLMITMEPIFAPGTVAISVIKKTMAISVAFIPRWAFKKITEMTVKALAPESAKTVAIKNQRRP